MFRWIICSEERIKKNKGFSCTGAPKTFFVASTELGYSPLAKIFRFATGEQAPRWLSLKCEPNSCRWQEAVLESAVQLTRKERADHYGSALSFGSGTRIRTQTYRVRVCCATFTQFRFILRLIILAHKIRFVNTFFLFLTFFEKIC